jgi:hypothetical protein
MRFVPALNFHPRLQGHLALDWVRGNQIESGRLDLRAPEHALADVHLHRVFGHPHIERKRRRQLGIVLVDRIHVAVHEVDQTSAVALFDRGRVPHGLRRKYRNGRHAARHEAKQRARSHGLEDGFHDLFSSWIRLKKGSRHYMSKRFPPLTRSAISADGPRSAHDIALEIPPKPASAESSHQQLENPGQKEKRKK